MNAIWYIVAMYVETHGLTKVTGTQGKWNSWSDHSLHAIAATHLQASIDEQVVIEYTGDHNNKGTSSDC